MLIHSRLKALAVNMCQPPDRLRLYVGLTGSNNPRWLKAETVKYSKRFVQPVVQPNAKCNRALTGHDECY